MKHSLISALVLAAGALYAQDTLYTISGQKIPAKVIEINQNEIKYKKTNNIDGPTYVVDKTDVALIEYKNGTKELFGNGGQATEINTNDEVVINDPQPKQRVNVIIGGGWGWAGWPLFNTWNWWGGYRVYPRWHHHHRHHYYKPHRHHKRIHYGKRGR